MNVIGVYNPFGLIQKAGRKTANKKIRRNKRSRTTKKTRANKRSKTNKRKIRK